MRGAATLVVFLTEQFNQNTHWDEITRRFITATGEIHEHGETVLIMAHAANPEDVTAEVSRIFLGIQIQWRSVTIIAPTAGSASSFTSWRRSFRGS